VGFEWLWALVYLIVGVALFGHYGVYLEALFFVHKDMRNVCKQVYMCWIFSVKLK
jgi:hypothetical protein